MDELNYPDRRLLQDWLKGFPAYGISFPSHDLELTDITPDLYGTIPREVAVNRLQLLGEAKAWRNNLVIKQLPEPQVEPEFPGGPVPNVTDGICNEFKLGWLRGPWEILEDANRPQRCTFKFNGEAFVSPHEWNLKDFALMPVFTLEKYREGKWKSRLIFNYSHGKKLSVRTVNDLWVKTEVIAMQDISYTLETIRQYAVRTSEEPVLVIEDYKNAFKTLPYLPEHQAVLPLAANCRDDEGRCRKLVGIPEVCSFGLTASVHAWARVASLFTTYFRKRLFMPISIYVDDCARVESLRTWRTSRLISHRVAKAGGQNLDKSNIPINGGNLVRPTGPQKLLGLGILPGLLYTIVTVYSAAEWMGDLMKIITACDRGQLPLVEDVESLAGKNNFAIMFVIGRGAACINSVFYYYSNRFTSTGERKLMLRRLRRCAAWFHKAYSLNIRRIFFHSHADFTGRIAVIWTDSDANGRIGVVVAVYGLTKSPAECFWGITVVPEDWRRFFVQRDVQIQSWEMLGPLTAEHSFLFGERMPEFQSVDCAWHRIDNQAAMYVLAKGRAKRSASDHAEFASYMANFQFACGIADGPYSYVHTDNNPGDVPSRSAAAAEPGVSMLASRNRQWCLDHLGREVTLTWPPAPTDVEWAASQEPSATALSQRSGFMEN